jgi:hypothetical protein
MVGRLKHFILKYVWCLSSKTKYFKSFLKLQHPLFFNEGARLFIFLFVHVLCCVFDAPKSTFKSRTIISYPNRSSIVTVHSVS